MRGGYLGLLLLLQFLCNHTSTAVSQADSPSVQPNTVLNDTMPAWSILSNHLLYQAFVDEDVHDFLHALSPSANFATDASAFLQKGSVAFESQLCPGLGTDKEMPDLRHSILIAALLSNNEALMPHFLLQILQLVANTPVDKVFVSLYESSSSDRTGKLCCALAHPRSSSCFVLPCGLLATSCGLYCTVSSYVTRDQRCQCCTCQQWRASTY